MLGMRIEALRREMARTGGEFGGGAAVVEALRRQIEDYHRAHARGGASVFATGLKLLDRALPNGGLPRGAITEIHGDGPECGAWSLALRLARAGEAPSNDGETPRQANERVIVIVDTEGDFYPPAAAQHGLDLRRLIVVHTARAADAFWAVDQAVRCSMVSAVIAPFSHMDERASRRLQLAAEAGGGIGLLLRRSPPRSRSFAAVQILVERVPRTVGSMDAHPIRLTLLKVREGMPSSPFVVDLRHETGAGHLPSLSVDRAVAKTA